jgi:hypothetical protein
MKELIIGSTALKHYFPYFPREPKDLDIAVLEKKRREDNIEYLENPIILKYQKSGYLEPNLLLSLKISHLFWKTNWEKHLFDVQFLLGKGCKYNLELVNELRAFWEDYLPKIKRSGLEQDKEDFFTNSVDNSVGEHDYLHTLLAEIPAYTKILKDGCEVELDESKWEALSFCEKCDVVFEETSVMAFERFKDIPYRIAYVRQLKQCIMKHFPQFIAIFAIENYKDLERPKFNFKTKIENELQIN